MRSGIRALVAAATVATMALAAAPVPTSQDDAGTGVDAGDELSTAVAIDLRTAYDATLLPSGTGATSDHDWFTFQARAGDVVVAEVLATDPNPLGAFCLTARDADGRELLERECDGEIVFEAADDGTYVFDVGYFVAVPANYRFRVRVTN